MTPRRLLSPSAPLGILAAATYRTDGQTSPQPPSTLTSMPLVNELSSLAKNSAAVAISCGFPNRPRGMRASMAGRLAAMISSGTPILPAIGVLISPGLRLLTRILRSFKSLDQLRAKARTAALAPP